MGVAKSALESTVRYLAAELGEAGIRVNALSAGPCRTLSSMAIEGIGALLDHVEEISPLRRNIETDDIGKAAVYLLSDLASGVTGETHHVDAGYHAIAMQHHIADHERNRANRQCSQKGDPASEGRRCHRRDAPRRGRLQCSSHVSISKTTKVKASSDSVERKAILHHKVRPLPCEGDLVGCQRIWDQMPGESAKKLRLRQSFGQRATEEETACLKCVP